MRFISPSDFAFLYDACPRCFWAKVHGLGLVREALPPVVGHVDRAMKAGIGVETLRAAGLPVAEMLDVESVLSKPLKGIDIQIRGRLDRLVRLDDGELMVLDYKMSRPAAGSRYGRQLHAYAHALAHPAQGEPLEVTRLGLVCFDARQAIFRTRPPHAALQAPIAVVELPFRPAVFEFFVGELAAMLDGPIPPAGPACESCRVVARLIEEHMRLSRV